MTRRLLQCIFSLTAGVIMLQLFVDPYIGIANNGDFERLMSPVGIAYRENPWAEENYDHYFWYYITNDFEFIEPAHNDWFSIAQFNMILSKWLCRMVSKTGFYDLRYLGAVNAAFHLGAFALILYCISKQNKKWKIFIFGILAAIFAIDGYVVQYMNSFFSEIVSLISTMFFLGFAWLIFLKKEKEHKMLLLFLMVVAGVFGAVNKQQDILCIISVIFLAICTILFAMELSRAGKIRACVTMSCVCLLLALGLTILNKGAGNTCANVMLHDILPETSEPVESLEIMGFQGEEIKEVQAAFGSDTFSFEGPKVFEKYRSHFTRTNEAKVLLHEPEIIIKMIVNRAQYLFQDAPLGNFLEKDGIAPGAKSISFRSWFNVKSRLYQSSFAFYITVILLSVAISLIQIKKGTKAYCIVLSMALSNILRYLTIILGDRSNDDIKHFFMVNVEFDVLLICVVLSFAISVLGRFLSGEHSGRFRKIFKKSPV